MVQYHQIYNHKDAYTFLVFLFFNSNITDVGKCYVISYVKLFTVLYLHGFYDVSFYFADLCWVDTKSYPNPSLPFINLIKNLTKQNRNYT